MKYILALLIIVPTLIAILLFTVAGFAYHNPAMLSAESNPTIAVICVIAGVFASLPLIVAIAIGVSNILKIRKKTKVRKQKDE